MWSSFHVSEKVTDARPVTQVRWGRWIKSTFYPVVKRPILILRSHVHLDITGGQIPSCSLIKISVYILLSYVCHMSYPSHSPWLDQLILWEKYKAWSSHYTIFSSLRLLPLPQKLCFASFFQIQCVFSWADNKFYTHTKQVKLLFGLC